RRRPARALTAQAGPAVGTRDFWEIVASKPRFPTNRGFAGRPDSRRKYSLAPRHYAGAHYGVDPAITGEPPEERASASVEPVGSGSSQPADERVPSRR